jgi:hypothetical protein
MNIVRVACLALIFASAAVSASPAWADANGEKKQIWGEVTTLNLQHSPPIIVLKAKSAKNEELIVGATVGPEATVTRKGKPAALETLQAGDRVALTYIKSEKGLAAVAVQAR